MFFDEVLVGDVGAETETPMAEVTEIGIQGPEKPKPSPPRMSQVCVRSLWAPHVPCVGAVWVLCGRCVCKVCVLQTVAVTVETRVAPSERPSEDELARAQNARQMQAVANPPRNWLRRRRCPPVSRPRTWRVRAKPLVYKAMDSEDEQRRIARSKRWVQWHRQKARVDEGVRLWQAQMRQRVYGPVERRRVSDEKQLRREGDAALALDLQAQGKLELNMRQTAFTRVRGGRRAAFRLERRMLPQWREPFDTHKEALRITK
eukprot:Gregarina_sp_Pseudo_9__5132@NODE_540_length_2608_cov_12_461269_g510_i0_p2_GENE_NODE_540_length_2608_cov_12_461269_g510_i0NODE_540_length_2608_cov_12_461269_g510_i0_p2_ORF_typecomplete_len260_score88_71_NODE_540_length_2608_cov_12_461269_g510_i015002279